jgi:hypothetical protein
VAAVWHAGALVERHCRAHGEQFFAAAGERGAHRVAGGVVRPSGRMLYIASTPDDARRLVANQRKRHRPRRYHDKTLESAPENKRVQYVVYFCVPILIGLGKSRFFSD